MECKVKWIDGVSFVAETGSGHALVMDGAPEGGGRNLGPRPMEMVLLGTGGCSAYDVVVILKKSGQEISGCSVELKAERAETDPKIFTRIHMHFVLRGRNLKTSMVESAIKLSHQKYCSASIMLGKTAADHARLRNRRGVSPANRIQRSLAQAGSDPVGNLRHQRAPRARIARFTGSGNSAAPSA